MSSQTPLRGVLWRDRLLILGGLAVLTLLAWISMAHMAASMNGPTAASRPMPAWELTDFFVAFGMWSIMMMGMMLPSASPMVLTFSGISRRRTSDRPYLRTSLFAGGYILVWVEYSAAGALAQGGFQAAALVSPVGRARPHTLPADCSWSLVCTSGHRSRTPASPAAARRWAS